MPEITLDEVFGDGRPAGKPTGAPAKLNDPGTVQIAEHLAAGMGQHLPYSGKVRDGFLYAAREIRRGTDGHSDAVAGLCAVVDEWFASSNWARTLDHPQGAVQPVARRWCKEQAARELPADPVASYMAAQAARDERQRAKYTGGKYGHLVQR